MCIAIEYVLNGEPQTVSMDGDGELPVRLRGGKVKFYAWGAGSEIHALNTPGWLGKFPEGTHAPLESIRADEWVAFEPRAVRIAAARFVMLDRWQVPRCFELRAGEYLQGLVATVGTYERLHVVTVPAPAAYREDFPEVPGWPRVVSARRNRQ